MKKEKGKGFKGDFYEIPGRASGQVGRSVFHSRAYNGIYNNNMNFAVLF